MIFYYSLFYVNGEKGRELGKKKMREEGEVRFEVDLDSHFVLASAP